MVETADATELELVNRALREGLGVRPVASLSSPSARTQMAIDAIAEARRDIQADEWLWNTERRVELVPVADEITVPTDYLSVRPDPEKGPGYRLAKRGGKLVRLDTDSTTFTGSVHVLARVQRALADVPPDFKAWIAAKAATSLCRALVNDRTRLAMLTSAEDRARAAAMQSDAVAAAYNSKRGPLDALRFALRRRRTSPFYGG